MIHAQTPRGDRLLNRTGTDASPVKNIASGRGWLPLIGIVLLLAGGCRVGPNYCPPPAPISAAWIDAANPQLIGSPEDPRLWWTVFEDLALDSLIEQVHEQNLTLRQAGARVLEARAALGIARGNLGPQKQEIDADYRAVRISPNSPFAPLTALLGSDNFDRWTLEFGAAWELDFWGRYRRAIDSASAELDATLESYDDALVILVAETARTYVDLCTQEQRLALARENVRIQRETLRLTEIMAEAGTVSKLDVYQATTNLKETESLVPELEARRRAATNRLCVLLGIPCIDLLPDLSPVAKIPLPPKEVTVGVPADLLRRRPDVRRAERELAAQSERIGIAAAEFYPHISILGNIGLDAQDFSRLFNLRSWSAVAGPSLRWNILHYGRLKNGVRLEEARYERLALAYQSAVLAANEEVETALTRFLKAHERVELLGESVVAAKQSVEAATAEYRGGKTDFQRVFVLDTQLVRKQDAFALAQGELASSLIAVYQALGGGWELRCQ